MCNELFVCLLLLLLLLLLLFLSFFVFVLYSKMAKIMVKKKIKRDLMDA